MSVRLLRDADLPLTLPWRNNPAIRHASFNQHEISAAEHEAWFARCQADPDRTLLMFELHDVPSGVVQLTRLHGSDIATWSFYVAPQAPRGCGTIMGQEALRYAFTHLALHKVTGEVLATNPASIRMHEKLGFSQEGRLREHSQTATTHLDVLCFGLLRSEWEPSNQ